MNWEDKIKQDWIIWSIHHGDITVLDEFGFTEDAKKEIIEYAEKRRKKIVRMAKRLGESAKKMQENIMQDVILEESKCKSAQ